VGWKERSTMSLRKEFVELALREGVNRRALMRRFEISPTTGYKLLARYRAEGEAGLLERSRRPQRSPRRTPAALEEVVVALRDAHLAWGGRTLRTRLLALGHAGVPAPSTITAIVRRHGRVVGGLSAPARPRRRFEAAHPNALWQMDFKGHFALHSGRCHPLTVLDDHSRFALGLCACGDERTATVERELGGVFARYGLPERILTDNGPPWGNAAGRERYTKLTVWLIRLGIQVLHGRPHHPQTQGKVERFHRTLAAEVLAGHQFRDCPHAQRHFDRWRSVYNTERPHHALAMQPPLSRYAASPRSLPPTLPAVEYAPGDDIRRVQWNGEIYFAGRRFRIGKAFHGFPVALRPTAIDGELEVFFCHQRVRRIRLNAPD
jgi:transposase InsO family protein